jgi:hypothetical protein
VQHTWLLPSVCAGKISFESKVRSTREGDILHRVEDHPDTSQTQPKLQSHTGKFLLLFSSFEQNEKKGLFVIRVGNFHTFGVLHLKGQTMYKKYTFGNFD